MSLAMGTGVGAAEGLAPGEAGAPVVDGPLVGCSGAPLPPGPADGTAATGGVGMGRGSVSAKAPPTITTARRMTRPSTRYGFRSADIGAYRGMRAPTTSDRGPLEHLFYYRSVGGYVELHCHSNFSFLDGASAVDDL